ncbi:Ion transport protein-domain-containing protein [Lactarius hatsudake]|nr:Ion transport protein-domain-containing protein [Lactarius hatsudake]
MDGAQHSTHSSTSSAIELAVTSAGIGPSSPSLVPSGDSRNSFTRRRLSWGRVESGQDPLRPDSDLSAMNNPGPSSRPSSSSQPAPAYAIDDDPFMSPTQVDRFRVSTATSDYGVEPFVYTDHPRAGASTTSLISSRRQSSTSTFDDSTHLTANMPSEPIDGGNWRTDSENSAATTPRTRRRTQRYSAELSPLSRSGTTIKSISQGLRRISVRVVNFASSSLEDEDHVRLGSDDGEERVAEVDEPLPDSISVLPLRGRTLGFFGSTSRVRLAMYDFLVFPWTEIVILCSILFYAILLTIQASRSLTLSGSDATPPRVLGFFQTWEDYIIFSLFVLFSFEAFSRICVSGLILDPEVPIYAIFTSPFSTDHSIRPVSITPAVRSAAASPTHPITNLDRKGTLLHRLRSFYGNTTRPFALSSLSSRYDPPTPLGTTSAAASSTTLVNSTPLVRKRADTTATLLEKTPSSSSTATTQYITPAQDTLVLPFQFSMRLARNVTRRNLPYLRHSWTRIDAIAVVAFWISFVLAQTGAERGRYHIGIFRALSVLRTARLLTITSGTTTIMRSLKTARPLLASVAYFVLFAMALFSIIGIQTFKGSLRRSCYLEPTLGEPETQLVRSCGGYIDPGNFTVMPYITQGGRNVTIKGYICPVGQICKEADNPQGNIESFDTIYFAALQVFIVASANGVTIREETQKSAFSASPLQPIVDEQDEAWAAGVDGRRRAARRNPVRDLYEHIRWCWVALALASLVLQATREVDITPTHQQILNIGELVLTIAFDIEIAVRIVAHLPDWRSFFVQGNNYLDLVLAIGSTVIQIPVVHDSPAYPWLTIFQLARFYRVILEIPRMKPLLMSVFGNMHGLANMSLFLILVNYLAALFAVQLLRGDLQSTEAMNFGQIFTSFLAIYQIFSSENWTNVLYSSAMAEIPLGQSWIVVIFIVGWFFFANFIVLQMFIAVINENFSVAEEAKRSQQANLYFRTQEPDKHKSAWVRKLNPYRWFRPSPRAIVVESLPSNLVLPMQKTLVQDYGLPAPERRPTRVRTIGGRGRVRHVTNKSLSILQKLFIGDTQSDDVPLTTLRHARKQSATLQNSTDEDTDGHLDLLAAINNEGAMVEEVNDALDERRAIKADFIRDHPSYDKTFWIFSQKNVVRRFCQTIVRPAGGDRIFGRAPSKIAHIIFQLVLLLTVIAGIVVESIATPVHRRKYYLEHGRVRGSWFDIAESTFGLTLLMEFVIKVVADGFMFTPNAYVRSIWNVLDFFIMAGLLVNVTTGLIFIGGLSRFTRALKALRALKLITLIEKMRSTFESLIISGITRILDAALLALLYMIPYAVWGLNIFAGLTNQCNDGNATGLTDCINEYNMSVVGDPGTFAFPVPRVWANPSPSTTFSFDSFRASLLILFEIVSLEGWIDVMGVVTSITGPNQQPQTNASQVNAIFFVIYNLLGGVVILTLFVSIIIGNFSAKTGTALLTQPQREWIDLQKLIKRQRPSKRPKTRPTWRVRAWCFDRAVYKHGWWSRMMTVLFTIHIIALMTQTFSPQTFVDDFRNNFFLLITIMYAIDILVRFYGLGWRSFRANGWNMFDVIVASGSLITSISVRIGVSGYIIDQLQKLFLVSIAFKLVQRMNNLNKLFKTAVASLPVILSLLSLWLVLFIFFSILFVEVFSLTKWNTAEARNQNYSSMSNALVMLAFMTSGEGWNQYMHDYTTTYPRCTDSSPAEQDSDCGSVGWAYTLFIAWNILSMYIFVNMFTGVVVESFSYVYQTTGGAKAVTREEMRAFKKVWAEFANQKTGFLERPQFVPFFRKLGGIFEVRIYPTEFCVQNILATCTDKGDRDYPDNKSTHGVNLRSLNTTLSTIDYAAIRRRRKLFSRLTEKGISFTNMLLLLAHHKLIVDNEALVLKDLVVRTGTNGLVTDLVNLDRVRSMLKTISYRRRFLAMRQQAHAAASDHDVPEIIVVEDVPSTPPPLPMSSRDITSARRHSAGFSWIEPETPTRHDQSGPSDFSPLGSNIGSSSGGLRRDRRESDMSALSAELGLRYTRDLSAFRDSTSFSVDDDHDVLASIQNSSWGAMMLEAEEEEQKERR